MKRTTFWLLFVLIAISAQTMTDLDYLSIDEPVSESKLSKPVKDFASRLRDEAHNGYGKSTLKEMKTTKDQRPSSVKYRGIVTEGNGLKVHCFLETGMYDQREAYFCVESDKYATRYSDKVTAYCKWAGRIDGFNMDRPLVSLVPVPNSPRPWLAVREQYHNGTSNACLIKYYVIQEDMRCTLAFCMEEKALLDYSINGDKEEGIIIRKAVFCWDEKLGQIRPQWEVWSGTVTSVGYGINKLVGTVELEPCGGENTSFCLRKETVIDPRYEGRLITAGLEAEQDQFISHGEGYFEM